MVWDGIRDRDGLTVADRIDRGLPIRLIILKARREGLSTEIESWLMAMIAAGDLVNALVTAHQIKAAQRIWAMSKRFVTSSPLLKKVATIGNNTIALGQSTLEVATAGNPESERSGDLTAVHFSEAAFYKFPEVMVATMQTLPPKNVFSIGAIESTANGKVGEGRTFYQEWLRAEEGDSDWMPIFLSWMDFDDYQMPGIAIEEPDVEEQALRERFKLSDARLAWRRWAIANLTQGNIDLFHQEYPACVRTGTRLSTNLGIIPVEQAQQATRTESGAIRAWGPQPVSPLYRLETTSRRILDGTADHPVRLANGAWCGLSLLRPGDRIRLLRPMFADHEYVETWQSIPAATTTVRLTADLARLLGYFIGDGAWYKGTFGIACDAQDGDVVEEVAHLVRTHLGEPKLKTVSRIQGRKGCVYVNISRVAALPVLSRLGLVRGDGSGFYKKHLAIPECIWQSPRVVVAAFLSGLFEADGSASGGYVRFYSKSLDLMRSVQLLLLGFAIPVSISEATRRMGSGKVYTGYTLQLGRIATELFNADIGFRSVRKRNKSASPRRHRRPAVPLILEEAVASVMPLGAEVSWNLTVEPTHVFSANGIETHNTSSEAFIQSGLPFFRNEHLLPLEKDVYDGTRGVVDENGQFTKSPQGWLELFKMPEAGHEYCIGADSSFGIDDDDELTSTHSRSAGEVIDMDTLEQVAEYDAATAPHIMAKHLVGMGRLYNNALLAPEVQSAGGGGGRELLVYIREMDYWNLHRWRGQIDRIQRDTPVLYGWETTSRTRPRMLARIRQVVMEQSATIHSRRLMNQLASFGENDAGRMESLQGHDDLLFAWGIALMSRSENYFKLVQPPPAEMLNPDWQKLGLHVVREEHPEARLRRLLAIADTEVPERSFMEL